MMQILEFFSNRAWQHLIAALLHTIWQGALLALLLSLALRRLPAYRHDARYLLALAAQFGVLLAGLATWSILEYEPARTPSVTSATTPPRAPASGSPPAAPSPIAAGTADTSLGEDRGPRWMATLALAWLIGVALMLGRTAGSVGSASRMVRGPRVGDPAILAMVGRIREELGIGRPIRVVDAGEGCGPSVLGVLWPTLLLPASAMTGLPADTLRAILIHELAHIRRYDYLVNIAQMVVESVLFFNPAVWWLGRQARLEREACCDAAAVRLTGRPIEYSRSLAEWAGRAPGVTIAAAWAGDRRSGTLLERIRRVLRPGERPSARVSPSGLLLLLLGGPALVAVLWRGTSAAVGLAAQVLSPAERIQRIEAAQAEYAPPIATSDGKGTLKGTIRTASGEPFTRPIWLYHRTDRPGGGGITGTLNRFASEFSVEVPAGTTWLSVNPDDFAPAVVGPFKVRPGRTIDGIRIILEAGSPAKVAVTDGQGRGVPGARVFAYPLIDGRSSIGGSADGWTTDRDGIATILHAVERPYSVTVAAPGYEPLESVALTLSFEQATVLTVQPTRPARGVAVDPQGRPIAGAEVRVYREESEDGGTYEHHVSGPLLATTDADGRFTLDTLKGRSRYILFVTSKAGGRGISPPIRAGQDGIRVTVGPKWTIRGTIKPGGDAGDRAGMPATVDVQQRFSVPTGREATYRVGWSIPVDRQGHFSITNLLPCETVLEATGRTVRVNPDGPETSVTIDLGTPAPQPPTRRVVLRITTPDGAVPPSGTISAYAYRPDEAMTAPSELTIENGRAAFDARVPSRVMYQLRSMVGYWFKDAYHIEVEPGEGDKVIEIPAVPAGAIVGQVLDADGKPAHGGVSISCRTVEAAPGLKGEVFIKNDVRVDAQGHFFASPLPLGGSYAVIAGRGHNRQVGAPVRLDGSNPTETVTIRMARDAAAEGRVVGPDGRPIAGVPVKLELVHPIAGQGWLPPKRTDDDGRFRFDDLNPELNGYVAIAQAAEGFQPAQAALRPGGPPAAIRLERGHTIAGRVVDARTGWPIPGVTVYARRPEWIAGQRNFFEAQGKTDDGGRFRFSNLPEGTWTLNDREGLEWQTPHKSHVFGVDAAEPVEIRATLPSWSKLKPRAPGGE